MERVAVVIVAEQPGEPHEEHRAPCARLAANTVCVTVDLTPEQFALLDQALGAIRPAASAPGIRLTPSS